MGRLTRRTECGAKCAYDPFKCEDQYEDGGCGYCVHMLAMMGKLAAYEEAEEQGLLLRLPCKNGDVVWAIRNYKGIKHVQKGFVNEMFFTQEMKLCIVVKNVARGFWGETIFLTQEEAEKALAERGK